MGRERGDRVAERRAAASAGLEPGASAVLIVTAVPAPQHPLYLNYFFRVCDFLELHTGSGRT